VPPEADAVRVGLAAGQPVGAALLDERVLGVVEQGLGVDRIAEVGHPAAHATTLRRRGRSARAGLGAVVRPARDTRDVVDLDRAMLPAPARRRKAERRGLALAQQL